MIWRCPTCAGISWDILRGGRAGRWQGTTNDGIRYAGTSAKGEVIGLGG